MKQTAVEFLEETFNKKHAQFINWPEDYFNEAKEMEKQQQGYSEEDLKEAFKDAYAIGFRTSIFDVNLKQENCDEWFELFKNK